MVSEPEIPVQNSTMAASNSTTASSSSTSANSSTFASSSMNVMNQPLLLLSNMSNMMTVKLDNTNYIVWKHQITVILETYSLYELLEEPQLAPQKFLKDLSGVYTTIVNPEYTLWRSKEKALLTFISSTLSPSILSLTIGCTSALEVWKVLENRFSSISRSHVMNLKGKLHNLKKGTESVDAYLRKIKVVRDKLLAVGVILDDEELLHITLKGLPKEYNAFVSGIRTRSTPLSFGELSTMLNDEEESLNEGVDIKDSIFALAATTTPRPGGNFIQSCGNFSHHNRGRGRGNFNHRGGRGGRNAGNQSPHYNHFTPF